jgi:hypothetical protein
VAAARISCSRLGFNRFNVASWADKGARNKILLDCELQGKKKGLAGFSTFEGTADQIAILVASN